MIALTTIYLLARHFGNIALVANRPNIIKDIDTMFKRVFNTTHINYVKSINMKWLIQDIT